MKFFLFFINNLNIVVWVEHNYLANMMRALDPSSSVIKGL